MMAEIITIDTTSMIRIIRTEFGIKITNTQVSFYVEDRSELYAIFDEFRSRRISDMYYSIKNLDPEDCS